MTRKNGLIAALLILNCHLAFSQRQPVDVLIKNAYVFNGDGKDSVLTNVGVTGQRISYIGKDDIESREVIDAKGKFLAPGFIDTHTHAEGFITDRKRNEMLPWVYQGVTTVFTGNDGFGSYKVADKMATFENIGMGTNFAFYVGFGSIRQRVLGNYNIQPTPKQLTQMKEMVDGGLEEGAIGLSTGLSYLPQMYSTTEEIATLFKAAKKYNAVYDTHMRSEGTKIDKSIDEVITIGDDLNLPLHISHIKIAGESNWGKADAIIKKINEARARGVSITANQYPFIASMTGLKATLIPAWAQEGGSDKTLERFENPKDLERLMKSLSRSDDNRYKRIIVVPKNKRTANLAGKSIYEIAQMWGKSNAQTAIDILKMNIGASCINFMMSEDDLMKFMQQPWVMTGSDGGGLHPRTYSTFTRIIEEYVQKQKLMSLAWAIRRATGLTADTFSLKDRGYIKEGYYADLIIFEPQLVKAHSTFAEPEQYSSGMDYVFVNGVKTIDKGVKTGKLAGQIIKNTNYVQNK